MGIARRELRWQVLLGDGGSSPIEDLEIGQRVTVPGEFQEQPLTVQSGEEWRELLFQLEVPEYPGDIHDITLLRPLSWTVRMDCQAPGDRLWLDLDDMGVSGPAVVTGVKSVPAPAAGPGRAITGTFTHRNTDLREITFTTPGQTLRVTGLHRLWSVSRNDWTRVAELLPSEILQTSSGTVQIQSLGKVPGSHRV